MELQRYLKRSIHINIQTSNIKQCASYFLFSLSPSFFFLFRINTAKPEELILIVDFLGGDSEAAHKTVHPHQENSKSKSTLLVSRCWYETEKEIE
jgi:hypothetical protein